MTPIAFKEIQRKTFHVICTSILACIMLFHTPYLLYSLLIMLSGMMVYETARHHTVLYTSFIQPLGLQAILREHEKTSLTGATYTVSACFVSYFIFQPFTSMLGLLILAWSDTAAAIFGMYFGGKKIHGKTLSGSTAFFLTSCCIVALMALVISTDKAYWIGGIGAAFMSTMVERYAQWMHLDDNLVVPLSFGISFESILALIHMFSV